MKNIALKPIIFTVLLITACDKTVVPKLPVFSDTTISNISTTAASVSTSITDSGDGIITEHGFVISEDSLPKLEESSIKRGSINPTTPVPIAFSNDLSGLKANTTYFVSPYVVVESVPRFGKTAKFKTLNIQQPGITTVGSSGISHNAATLAGRITAAGTSAITEYGMVWNTAANPTTALTTKTSVKANVAQFPFNFTANASNLQPNTDYHFRAYVVMNGTTTYGANMTFKTGAITQPGIATGNADNITINSARLAGTVTVTGTHPITERGVAWATSANPTTANSKTSISGDVTTFPNNYTVNAGGLNVNTTYNYRAYVVMNGVTTYGENKTFKTSEVVEPGVETGNATSISLNTATLGGTLSSGGTYPITERGVVWGTSANPTTANSKASLSGNVTSFPHNYTINASGLNPGTTYHFRAYVISNGQVKYGSGKTFTTLSNPSLRTDAYTTRSVPAPNCPPGTICGDTQYIKFNGTVTAWGGYRYPQEVGFIVGRDRRLGNVDIAPVMSVGNGASLGVYANHKKSISPPGANQFLFVPYAFNVEIVHTNTFTGSSSGKYYYRAYIITPDGKIHYGDTKSVTFSSGPIN